MDQASIPRNQFAAMPCCTWATCLDFKWIVTFTVLTSVLCCLAQTTRAFVSKASEDASSHPLMSEGSAASPWLSRRDAPLQASYAQQHGRAQPTNSELSVRNGHWQQNAYSDWRLLGCLTWSGAFSSQCSGVSWT
jgi:hypothetical protein